MTFNKLSTRGEIVRRSEVVIDMIEDAVLRLAEIEEIAKGKSYPHAHYKSLQHDLQMYVDRFKRIMK